MGQVYTVFSTKGGVGKTFVSINLAASLAKNTEKRVVLVDLDLDFGNAALALNLYPKFTITDVIDDIRHMDSDLIESYLIPHASGIKVLPANLQPAMNDFINAEHIHVILESLRESFDYVVVDMPGRFVETIMPALGFGRSTASHHHPGTLLCSQHQSVAGHLEGPQFSAIKNPYHPKQRRH